MTPEEFSKTQLLEGMVAVIRGELCPVEIVDFESQAVICDGKSIYCGDIDHFTYPEGHAPKTLRDEFAMAAMQGDLASPATSGICPGTVQDFLEARAELYYRMADAMMKARGK